MADQVYDSAKSEIVFTGRVLHPPPLRLGVIVGDLVHNVRSALDHLVWQLVLANAQQPTRATQFPVCSKREQWAWVRARSLAGV